MKREVIKVPVGLKTYESSQVRVWSTGRRISRADSPRAQALDVTTVDAVFEEPSMNFLEESSARPNSSIESLTMQLSELEAQCAKLRSLLKASSVL